MKKFVRIAVMCVVIAAGVAITKCLAGRGAASYGDDDLLERDIERWEDEGGTTAPQGTG